MERYQLKNMLVTYGVYGYPWKTMGVKTSWDEIEALLVEMVVPSIFIWKEGVKQD